MQIYFLHIEGDFMGLSKNDQPFKLKVINRSNSPTRGLRRDAGKASGKSLSVKREIKTPCIIFWSQHIAM